MQVIIAIEPIGSFCMLSQSLIKLARSNIG